MPTAEKMLIHFLNYTYDERDTEVYGKAVIRIRNAFLNYWKIADRIHKTNHVQLIKKLYIGKEKKSLHAIAKSANISLETLDWYRDVFMDVFVMMIQNCKKTDKFSPII